MPQRTLEIPTEPIGSIPRPPELVAEIKARGQDDPALAAMFDDAVRDTIDLFEATGSPIVTDGEQRKFHNFWTYAVEGLENTAPDGFEIPFAAGHIRRMPRLTAGPLHYKRYAGRHVEQALQHAHVPMKTAIISPSALSMLYPEEPLTGYSRDEFIEDLVREHVTEIRGCLQKGAQTVQIDFTEGRLAVKIDPSGELLASFVDLNNLALARLSQAERARTGVHTCPGGDCDSTHSADVDDADLLPSLFQLDVQNFYVALAGEPNRRAVLEMIREHMQPNQRVFVGVVAPIYSRVETPEEVRDRVLEAAEYIPLEQLGTTDDCGIAPFSDDMSTTRAKAFAKIRARVIGTALAAEELGSHR